MTFVENSSDNDSFSAEKSIFDGLLKLGNDLLNLYVCKQGTGNVGKNIVLKDGNKLTHQNQKTIKMFSIF